MFNGKKVGIFYGATSDAPEVTAVKADLAKLHVDLADTALEDVPFTDTVASDQQTQTIETKFQNEGINVVLGVGGSGSTTWPRVQLHLQSQYKPLDIATSESSYISYVVSTKGANPYLNYTLAATSTPNVYQQWKDPAIPEMRGGGAQGLPVGPGLQSGQSRDDGGHQRHHLPVGDRGLPVPRPLRQDRRRPRART